MHGSGSCGSYREFFSFLFFFFFFFFFFHYYLISIYFLIDIKNILYEIKYISNNKYKEYIIILIINKLIHKLINK